MRQVIYIFTFLVSTLSFAQNDTRFDEANAMYNTGNYADALEKYKTILETEQHSAELYFNIANAHYKLNHIAPSIYYYEKALLLSPNDKDIKNNIAYARNMTIDDIEVVPEVGFSGLIKKVTNTFSFDNWSYITVILIAFFVILFLVYYFSYNTSKKRLAFVSSLTCLLVAFIALALAFHKFKIDGNNQPAIVFSKEAQIKSEPNLRSPEVFKLHEGTKVQVLDTVSNWKQIKLSDGKTGWVTTSDIRLLKDF